MKRQKFRKPPLAIIFILSILFSSGFASAEEYDKKLNKTYDVNKNSILSLSNRFGDINIENWEKNQVQIDVVITVENRNEEKAKETLEYIKVNFSEDGDIIKVETEIDNDLSKAGNWVIFGSNNSNSFNIDYTIKMPKSLQIELENKYGDVFINELSNLSNIVVKYGYLKINKMTRENEKPLNEVTLAYSNGDIESCRWLKLTLKYSKMEIKESKAIMAITKYSKLYIDQASSIVSESKFDEYNIGNITNFLGEGAYTDYDFDEITKKFELETKYGNCDVQYVPEGFEMINITNHYGNISIGIDDKASYKIKGEAKYGDIRIPGEGRVSRIRETTSTSLKGYVGSDENTNSIVEIYTKYEDVKLY